MIGPDALKAYSVLIESQSRLGFHEIDHSRFGPTGSEAIVASGHAPRCRKYCARQERIGGPIVRSTFLKRKRMGKPTTFEQFWPDYLRAHCDGRSRILHLVGTIAAFICFAVFLLTCHPAWFLAAPIFAYGFAWTGHALFEKNSPATFSHPLWSLRGDLRMVWLTITGRIENEIARTCPERL